LGRTHILVGSVFGGWVMWNKTLVRSVLSNEVQNILKKEDS